MVLDINILREDKGGNPADVLKSEKNRYKDSSNVTKLITFDKEYRLLLTQTSSIRKELNSIQKEIGSLKKLELKTSTSSNIKTSPNTQNIEEKKNNNLAINIAKKKELENKLKELETLQNSLQLKIQKTLKSIGNILKPQVPIGKDESSNTIRKEVNRKALLNLNSKEPNKNFKILPDQAKLAHDEVMKKLGGLETKSGSKIAGHRGYFLKGNLFLLAQALQQYAMKFLIERGYEPIQPPYFMKTKMLEKTSQLSDFEDTLYALDDSNDSENEKGDKGDINRLIATSEQPISCLFADELLDLNTLESFPLRFAGFSTCFRKEAGSSGKDIRGIFRVHQFEKVEQFVYCLPEDSDKELEKMIETAEIFLESLGLGFRSVYVASGELNDAAAIKVDIEAYFPVQKKYRELMSCSNCTDYQSREVNLRIKQGNKKFFPHLLNATLCAVQRTLCCLVENYQSEEGVLIPDCLKPYYLGEDKFIIKYSKN